LRSGLSCRARGALRWKTAALEERLEQQGLRSILLRRIRGKNKRRRLIKEDER
jgi:hypothetical protein